MNRARLHLLPLVALALVLAFAQTSEAQSGDRYAAVAWSPSTGRYGYSYNCRTYELARAMALEYCNASDARIVIWTRNGYIAIARGYGRSIGWARASDAETARRLALGQCLRFSNYAAIAVCVHAHN